MTFDKCTINGRMYGDLFDDEGNSIDITEVSFIIYTLQLFTRQWRSGKALDLRSIGRGFNSHSDKAA